MQVGTAGLQGPNQHQGKRKYRANMEKNNKKNSMFLRKFPFLGGGGGVPLLPLKKNYLPRAILTKLGPPWIHCTLVFVFQIPYIKWVFFRVVILLYHSIQIGSHTSHTPSWIVTLVMLIFARCWKLLKKMQIIYLQKTKAKFQQACHASRGLPNWMKW